VLVKTLCHVAMAKKLKIAEMDPDHLHHGQHVTVYTAN